MPIAASSAITVLPTAGCFHDVINTQGLVLLLLLLLLPLQLILLLSVLPCTSWQLLLHFIFVPSDMLL
jgi:hypothetical protein